MSSCKVVVVVARVVVIAVIVTVVVVLVVVIPVTVKLKILCTNAASLVFETKAESTEREIQSRTFSTFNTVGIRWSGDLWAVWAAKV